MSCEVKPSLCQSLAAGLTAENVAEKYHVERNAFKPHCNSTCYIALPSSLQA